MAERNSLKRPVYIGDTALDCASAQEAGVPQDVSEVLGIRDPLGEWWLEGGDLSSELD